MLMREPITRSHHRFEAGAARADERELRGDKKSVEEHQREDG